MLLFCKQINTLLKSCYSARCGTRAFTLLTAVSQEREENRPYTKRMPHYDNESEENRRAKRIP
ncbi:hypothetical protein DQ961_00455 [Salmonella bongori]|nr:hypothetical protein [Salmonella bongori]